MRRVYLFFDFKKCLAKLFAASFLAVEINVGSLIIELLGYVKGCCDLFLHGFVGILLLALFLA